MVGTATVASTAKGFTGLWTPCAVGSTTLARPDVAIVYPPSCVFGSIPQGDGGADREGDTVELTYISNRYMMVLQWNDATQHTRTHQRITCLEFIIDWKDPVKALAMCLAITTTGGGPNYQNAAYRILQASGLFDRPYDLTEIEANDLPCNTMSAQDEYSLFNLKSGVKHWVRDQTAATVEELRDGRAMGKVLKHKWHRWVRPAKSFEIKADATNVTEAVYDTGIPIDSVGNNQVAVLEGGLASSTTVSAAHNHAHTENPSFQQEVSQTKNMGFKIHFKKPLKLKYLSTQTDGLETTSQIPQNHLLQYGTMWWSDTGEGFTVFQQKGAVEMRWKDP